MIVSSGLLGVRITMPAGQTGTVRAAYVPPGSMKVWLLIESHEGTFLCVPVTDCCRA